MYYSMARDLPLFEKLLRSAEYAIRSRSKELVYQTYGAAEMAYDLSGITKDESYQLNDLLVRKTLNNGRLMNEWAASTITRRCERCVTRTW